MKILFLNTFSTVHGGAERLLFDTSTELLARGHQAAIVVAHDDRRSPNPEMWSSAINRYYVPELIAPVTDRSSYNRFRRTESWAEGVRYLQDIVDIESPDLVHIHNFPSVEVLDELRIPVPIIRTIHSYENQCQNHLKRLPDGSVCSHPMGKACQQICGLEKTFRATRVRVENAFMKRRFNRFIAVSDYIRDVLLSNGFPSDRIRVLPNFTRMATGATSGIAEENAILYVGRLTPEKGLVELLDAVGRTTSRPRLIVVGKDGALGQSTFQDEVVERAARSGVEVEFNGWLAGEELRRAYARAKVVGFSSVWPEPFGLVGIEAMMLGKPVIAFDGGGVRQWLTDGKTGFLVPHLDIDAYAARIDELLGNDEVRRRMGEAASARARSEFAPEVYTNQLLDIYKEALDESAADRSRWSSAVRDAQCGIGVPV